MKARHPSFVLAAKDFLQSAGERAEWAIRKKDRMTALLNAVNKVIDHLENQLPSFNEAWAIRDKTVTLASVCEELPIP